MPDHARLEEIHGKIRKWQRQTTLWLKQNPSSSTASRAHECIAIANRIMGNLLPADNISLSLSVAMCLSAASDTLDAERLKLAADLKQNAAYRKAIDKKMPKLDKGTGAEIMTIEYQDKDGHAVTLVVKVSETSSDIEDSLRATIVSLENWKTTIASIAEMEDLDKDGKKKDTPVVTELLDLAEGIVDEFVPSIARGNQLLRDLHDVVHKRAEAAAMKVQLDKVVKVVVVTNDDKQDDMNGDGKGGKKRDPREKIGMPGWDKDAGAYVEEEDDNPPPKQGSRWELKSQPAMRWRK